MLMGCNCTSMCDSSVLPIDKPVGGLSVTTPQGVAIPVRYFNQRRPFTVVMSGAAAKSLNIDLQSLATTLSAELDCNLMAYWTDSPRKGSLMDLESVVWFVYSCSHQAALDVILLACEEEASDSLHFCSKFHQASALVLVLPRCGTDLLSQVLRPMARLDLSHCPVLLFHSIADSSISNTSFFASSATRAVRQVARESDCLLREVICGMAAFLSSIKPRD